MSRACSAAIKSVFKSAVELNNIQKQTLSLCACPSFRKRECSEVRHFNLRCYSSFKDNLSDEASHYSCVVEHEKYEEKECCAKVVSPTLLVQPSDLKNSNKSPQLFKSKISTKTFNTKASNESLQVPLSQTQKGNYDSEHSDCEILENSHHSSFKVDGNYVFDEHENPCPTILYSSHDQTEKLMTSSDQSRENMGSTAEVSAHVINSEEEIIYDKGMIDEDDDDSQIVVKEKMEFPPSYNLATYVNDSETLTNLVKLGVDLSEIEKKQGAADMLIKLDFEKDVKPYILFLKEIGIDDAKLGDVLTKVPSLFKEDLTDLEIRMNYLESKKFSKEAIQTIISRAPLFLLMKTPTVDGKLGYYQQEFMLKGDEVRSVVTLLPKLITTEIQRFKDVKFYMTEFLGFSQADLKKIFLSVPKVFFTSKNQLGERFDFLFNTMEIPHSQIVHWPYILRTRSFIIRDRHRFLLSIKRAQYNPEKVSYVPLSELAAVKDEDFCENVAKVPVSQFDEFLLSI